MREEREKRGTTSDKGLSAQKVELAFILSEMNPFRFINRCPPFISERGRIAAPQSLKPRSHRGKNPVSSSSQRVHTSATDASNTFVRST